MLWNRKKRYEWKAYIDGTLIPIESVPDEIFSTKMMGEGVAILAKGNILYAPKDGIIRLIAPTKHAIALELDHHIQILIHIGLDSANLPKDCFKVLVETNEKVKQSQPLIQIAESYLDMQKECYIPMVIIENPEQISFDFSLKQTVTHDESTIVSYVR